jgi:hypothetical protein
VLAGRRSRGVRPGGRAGRVTVKDVSLLFMHRHVFC